MSLDAIDRRMVVVAGAAVLAVALPAAVVVTRRKLRGRPVEHTKEELYREAQRRDILGRSRMTKAQLERALARA